MLVPKKDRVEIYSYLFKEGVIVCKKDAQAPKHPNINVPNLYVMKVMRSFASKGFVDETFNWRHYYYYLKNEGIEYLREYLHLPAEIIPATLKKTVRPAAPEEQRERRPRFGGERPPRREGGDREGYRRREGGDKKQIAPADFKPEFAAGGERQQRGEGAPRRGGFRGGRGGRGGFAGRGGRAPAGETKQ